MGPSEHPSSWRDVYQLVRDTRDDVLKSVSEVHEEVKASSARITAIEQARAEEAGVRRGQTRIFGIAKDTIALIASMLAAVVATLSILTRLTPH